jgi:hypothetical protein
VANIASLMLARTLARRRGSASAWRWGARAGRIARLLFMESLIVAVTGAALGWCSRCGARLLVQQ